MRAIDSAYLLSREINHSLTVIWEVNTELGIGFEELFIQVSDIHVIPRTPVFLDVILKSSVLKTLCSYCRFLNTNVSHRLIKEFFRNRKEIEKIRKFKIIYIETCDAFLYPEDFSEFVPVPSIKVKIDKLSEAFPLRIVGIHIRRTDHNLSIDASPNELFFDVVEKELHDDSDVHFFLSTDDRRVKDEMIKRFGGVIFTQQAECSRSSKNGMKDALVDLFLLARCVRIYATKGISFSETAHHLGHSPLIILEL